MVRADHICRTLDLRLALLLCIAALSRAAFASAPELRPPAEAFAQLPTIDLAAVSPNGKLLARDRNTAGATSLEIWDLDAGKLMRTVGIHTGERLLDVNWADDQTVLIDVGATVDFECRPPQDCQYDVNVTQAVDVAGGKSTVLPANRFGGRLISSFGAKPNTVLMVGMGTHVHAAGQQRRVRAAIVWIGQRSGFRRPSTWSTRGPARESCRQRNDRHGQLGRRSTRTGRSPGRLAAVVQRVRRSRAMATTGGGFFRRRAISSIIAGLTIDDREHRRTGSDRF